MRSVGSPTSTSRSTWARTPTSSSAGRTIDSAAEAPIGPWHHPGAAAVELCRTVWGLCGRARGPAALSRCGADALDDAGRRSLRHEGEHPDVAAELPYDGGFGQ